MRNFIKDIQFRKIIANNFWLKVISLAVAITIWLYVGGEIIKGVKI